tara:strand:- start:71 stop:454 length:384 start_codon:yes stop_codon:yes gene_type:complete
MYSTQKRAINVNKLFKLNDNGQRWTVRIVEASDHYGRNMCLTNENETLVEFYDARYAHTIAPDGELLGQFVSRYYLDTLTGKCKWSNGGIGKGAGFCLHGGVPDWCISAQSMYAVADFLTQYEEQIK